MKSPRSKASMVNRSRSMRSSSEPQVSSKQSLTSAGNQLTQRRPIRMKRLTSLILTSLKLIEILWRTTSSRRCTLQKLNWRTRWSWTNSRTYSTTLLRRIMESASKCSGQTARKTSKNASACKTIHTNSSVSDVFVNSLELTTHTLTKIVLQWNTWQKTSFQSWRPCSPRYLVTKKTHTRWRWWSWLWKYSI